MASECFTVTDHWLDHFRPRPGSSWTQDMLMLLDPEAWPRGRQSPVAGWRDRVRGRVITEAQRLAFETKVRESINHDVAYHVAGFEAAKQRLAALDRPSLAARNIDGWESWCAAPGVM